MFTNTQSKILYSRQLVQQLEQIINDFDGRKIFFLTEENTEKLCLPYIQPLIEKYSISGTVIKPGENAKSVSSVEQVWQFLSQSGADRKSLLINIGGGMLTDLGGFAASSFKRGIAFVNIPTTLLAQVDASIGGKTAINFNGLKNEIGIFNEPLAVIINTDFLKTLDSENFLSGYAEMLKHGLIKDRNHWDELMNFNITRIDYSHLQEIISHSVDIKKWHVENDPTENNIRKALNFGHTIGHAIESYALHKGTPMLHGYAVAYGMMAELYLSHKILGFPLEEMQKINQWLIDTYSKFSVQSTDFEALYELMTHDKKNENSKINFTLLSGIGQVEINKNCSRELVLEALEYYSNL